MEAVLYIITGVAVGFAVAYFMAKSQRQAAVAEVENRVRQEREQLQGALGEARQAQAIAESQLSLQHEQHEREMTLLRQQHEKEISTLREQHEKEIFTLRQQHEKETVSLKTQSEEQLQMLRQQHAEALQKQEQQETAMREELRKQTEDRVKLMTEEVKTMANTLFAQSRDLFNKADRERLDALLAPLTKDLATFRQAVADNSKETVAGKTTIKETFETAMRQLHEEQERTVRALKEQTDRIGNDAASLTQALKGDSKLQGDWGEMILEKTLEDCGLEKDKQFFLQENFKDEAGNNFRPDAVVEFPNGERTVIDSKVSLTAYHEAVKADTPELREQKLCEHVASVRHHIDELAAKNYDSLVKGCIGYVLMFVPYESGYSAALRTEPALLQYAYKKHIILLSPSNLLMALQLTNTMWQNYRLNKNVDEILRQSNDLYDKFATFAETFVKLEADMDRLHATYDKAKSQLREGNGNIVRRLDKIKSLGLNPKKQLPEQLG